MQAGGGALASKKLLAALAVLAVALVMLAAVPAVDAGSDADTYAAATEKTEDSVISFTAGEGTTTYYENTKEAMEALLIAINGASSAVQIVILDDYEAEASIGLISTNQTVTISGAKTDTENYTVSGLNAPFIDVYNSTTQNAVTITHLDITKSAITGEGGVAAFVGQAYGKIVIEGCNLSDTTIIPSEGQAWAAGFVAYPGNNNSITIRDCTIDGCKITNAYGSAGAIIAYGCESGDDSSHTVENVTVSNCTMTGAAWSGWWQVGIVYGYNMTTGNVSKVTVGENVILSENGITVYVPKGYNGYDYLYGFNSRGEGNEDSTPLKVDGEDVPQDEWVLTIYESKEIFGCAPVDYKNQYGKPLFDFNIADGTTSGSVLVGKTIESTDDEGYSFGKTFTVPEGFILEIGDSASISGDSGAVIYNYGTIRCATADADGKVTVTEGTIDLTDLSLDALVGSSTILSKDTDDKTKEHIQAAPGAVVKVATSTATAVSELKDAGVSAFEGFKANSTENINENIENGVTDMDDIDITSWNTGDVINPDKKTVEFTGSIPGYKLYELKGAYSLTHGSLKVNGVIQGGYIATTTGGDKVTLDGTITADTYIILGDGTSLEIGTLTIRSGAVLYIIQVGSSATVTVVPGAEVNLYGGIETIKNGERIETTSATSYTSVVDEIKITVEGPVKDSDGQITTAGARFVAYAGASLVKVFLDAEDGATVNLSKALETYQVQGTIMSDTTIGQLQNVEIVEDLTVSNKSDLLIRGSLVVDEGKTLTIESGSSVTVDSTTATVKVAGTIMVEDGASFVVKGAESVDVTGTVSSEGTVTIGSTLNIKEGGSVYIMDNTVDRDQKSIIKVEDGLTIDAGATLTVSGSMDISSISNSGSIVLNGAELATDSFVSLVASGASVDIQSVYGDKDLTINDKGLKASGKNATVINTLTLDIGSNAIVKGLKAVSSASVSSKNKVSNTIVLSGSITSLDSDNKPRESTITLTGDAVEASKAKGFAVKDSLDLGKEVTLTIGSASGGFAKLAVSGTVTATAEHSEIKMMSTGILAVSGLVQTSTKITEDVGTVNAVWYVTGTGLTQVNNYTSLESAVAAGATSITLCGDISVTSDLEIPAGTTVNLDDHTLTVGSSTDKAIVVTVADGASFKSGTADVLATLFFVNEKNNRTDDVISDVQVESGDSIRFTNVYTAIAGAKYGDTVTITRGSTLELNADLEVPAGVVLDVPNGEVLAVQPGVTLTVAGTLVADNDILAQKTGSTGTVVYAFAVEAKDDDDTGVRVAAIVVTGVLQLASTTCDTSADAFAYYAVAGAYFQATTDDGQYYYIAPVEIAADYTAYAQTFDVYGKNTLGEISFAGTADNGIELNIGVGAEVSVGKLNLSYTTLTVSNAKSFTGTVAVGDASIAVKGLKAFTVSSLYDKTPALTVESMTLPMDGSGTYAATVSAGTVYVKTVVGTSSIYTPSGSSTDTTVFNTLTVADGATLAPAYKSGGDSGMITGAALDVQGAVYIPAGATLTVDKAVVSGSVSSEAKTDSAQAGKLVFNALQVGVTDSELYTIGAETTVSGALSFNGTGAYAVVAASAALDQAAVTSLGEYSTGYYVEGTLWITVYAQNASSVTIGTITNAPITDGEFKNWMLEGDIMSSDVGDKYVGAEGYTEVTAFADYKIYALVIVTDGGIGRVTVNNVLMKSDGNTFYATGLIAGNYRIEFSAASGYDVSKVTLTDAEGTTVSGTTVTLSGTSGDKTTVSGDISGLKYYVSEYQLVGSETAAPSGGSSSGGLTSDDIQGIIDAIDKNTEATENIKVEGGSSKDSSLTDILLIVLVILIVIMAALVAMRMMRS